jgi:hypothetical protein
MRLMHTSSLWGVGYRHRFYIDGRRVTQLAFEDEFVRLGLDADGGRAERRGVLHRQIWETR